MVTLRDSSKGNFWQHLFGEKVIPLKIVIVAMIVIIVTTHNSDSCDPK